jgi:hypothetical protein
MQTSRDGLADSDHSPNGTTSFPGTERLFLFRQSLIGRDLAAVGIHVVDVEGRVGTYESGARGSARELMHVLARHHGKAPRPEQRGLAIVFHLDFGRPAHDHDLFDWSMPVPRDRTTGRSLEENHGRALGGIARFDGDGDASGKPGQRSKLGFGQLAHGARLLGRGDGQATKRGESERHDFRHSNILMHGRSP